MNRLTLLAIPLLFAACQGETAPASAQPTPAPAESAPAEAAAAPAAADDTAAAPPAETDAGKKAGNEEWVRGTVIQTISVLRKFNWQLASAANRAGAPLEALLVRPEQPVGLDFTRGAMAIRNACNTLVGPMQLTSDTLTVDTLVSTEKACSDPKLKGLDEAVAKHLKGKMTVRFAPGIEPRLSLVNEAGDTLIFNSTPTGTQAARSK